MLSSYFFSGNVDDVIPAYAKPFGVWPDYREGNRLADILRNRVFIIPGGDIIITKIDAQTANGEADVSKLSGSKNVSRLAFCDLWKNTKFFFDVVDQVLVLYGKKCATRIYSIVPLQCEPPVGKIEKEEMPDGSLSNNTNSRDNRTSLPDNYDSIFINSWDGNWNFTLKICNVLSPRLEIIKTVGREHGITKIVSAEGSVLIAHGDYITVVAPRFPGSPSNMLESSVNNSGLRPAQLVADEEMDKGEDIPKYTLGSQNIGATGGYESFEEGFERELMIKDEIVTEEPTQKLQPPQPSKQEPSVMRLSLESYGDVRDIIKGPGDLVVVLTRYSLYMYNHLNPVASVVCFRKPITVRKSRHLGHQGDVDDDSKKPGKGSGNGSQIGWTSASGSQKQANNFSAVFRGRSGLGFQGSDSGSLLGESMDTAAQCDDIMECDVSLRQCDPMLEPPCTCGTENSASNVPAAANKQSAELSSSSTSGTPPPQPTNTSGSKGPPPTTIRTTDTGARPASPTKPPHGKQRSVSHSISYMFEKLSGCWIVRFTQMSVVVVLTCSRSLFALVASLRQEEQRMTLISHHVPKTATITVRPNNSSAQQSLDSLLLTVGDKESVIPIHTLPFAPLERFLCKKYSGVLGNITSNVIDLSVAFEKYQSFKWRVAPPANSDPSKTRLAEGKRITAAKKTGQTSSLTILAHGAGGSMVVLDELKSSMSIAQWATKHKLVSHVECGTRHPITLITSPVLRQDLQDLCIACFDGTNSTIFSKGDDGALLSTTVTSSIPSTGARLQVSHFQQQQRSLTNFTDSVTHSDNPIASLFTSICESGQNIKLLEYFPKSSAFLVVTTKEINFIVAGAPDGSFNVTTEQEIDSAVIAGHKLLVVAKDSVFNFTVGEPEGNGRASLNQISNVIINTGVRTMTLVCESKELLIVGEYNGDVRVGQLKNGTFEAISSLSLSGFSVTSSLEDEVFVKDEKSSGITTQASDRASLTRQQVKAKKIPEGSHVTAMAVSPLQTEDSTHILVVTLSTGFVVAIRLNANTIRFADSPIAVMELSKMLVSPFSLALPPSGLPQTEEPVQQPTKRQKKVRVQGIQTFVRPTGIPLLFLVKMDKTLLLFQVVRGGPGVLRTRLTRLHLPLVLDAAVISARPLSPQGLDIAVLGLLGGTTVLEHLHISETSLVSLAAHVSPQPLAELTLTSHTPHLPLNGAAVEMAKLFIWEGGYKMMTVEKEEGSNAVEVCMYNISNVGLELVQRIIPGAPAGNIRGPVVVSRRAPLESSAADKQIMAANQISSTIDVSGSTREPNSSANVMNQGDIKLPTRNEKWKGIVDTLLVDGEDMLMSFVDEKGTRHISFFKMSEGRFTLSSQIDAAVRPISITKMTVGGRSYAVFALRKSIRVYVINNFLITFIAEFRNLFVGPNVCLVRDGGINNNGDERRDLDAAFSVMAGGKEYEGHCLLYYDECVKSLSASSSLQAPRQGEIKRDAVTNSAKQTQSTHSNVGVGLSKHKYVLCKPYRVRCVAVAGSRVFVGTKGNGVVAIDFNPSFGTLRLVAYALSPASIKHIVALGKRLCLAFDSSGYATLNVVLGSRIVMLASIWVGGVKSVAVDPALAEKVERIYKSECESGNSVNGGDDVGVDGDVKYKMRRGDAHERDSRSMLNIALDDLTALGDFSLVLTREDGVVGVLTSVTVYNKLVEKTRCVIRKYVTQKGMLDICKKAEVLMGEPEENAIHANAYNVYGILSDNDLLDINRQFPDIQASLEDTFRLLIGW